ncbi:MAG: outer membrane lipoprotein chaperone LolA [Gammaproteobacteria bacterium]|jgi:outer membrane lipoprotein carrier protein
MLRQFIRALLVLLAVTPAGAQEQGDDDGVASLRAFLADITTLEAVFEQTLSPNGDIEPQVSRGRFYLKRPGRFRWDYQEPAEQLVVSDGERIWMFDRDLDQVTVRPVDESLRGTPAMLLSGEASLDESFAVIGSRREDGIQYVTLEPRQASPEFESLTVGLAEGEIVSMELLDGIGQRSLIEFSDLRRDPPLDDELFRFEPPPGVDVIGAGED